jgi:hypothetical protein
MGIDMLDDYSSYATIYLLRHKSETAKCIKHYHSYMENQFHKGKYGKHVLKALRSDRGGEFISELLEGYFKENGINHQTSVPHISQQNGRAERINRTLMDKAESMRHNSATPESWWEFAIETATHVYNRTPLERTKWRTPFENIFEKKPDVNYFRTFGCLSYVWLHDAYRKNKLSPKAEKMTFIGYDQNTKGWKFMRKDNRIFIGNNAKFNELLFPRRNKQEPSPTGTRHSWVDDDSSDEDDNNNSSHQTPAQRNQRHILDQHDDSQDDEIEESQYFDPDSVDDSEEELEVERDIAPKTPERKQPPPKTEKTKKKVTIQTPPMYAGVLELNNLSLNQTLHIKGNLLQTS